MYHGNGKKLQKVKHKTNMRILDVACHAILQQVSKLLLYNVLELYF